MLLDTILWSLFSGGTCYRNFQCASNSCDTGAWHDYFGHCREKEEEIPKDKSKEDKEDKGNQIDI